MAVICHKNLNVFFIVDKQLKMLLLYKTSFSGNLNSKSIVKRNELYGLAVKSMYLLYYSNSDLCCNRGSLKIIFNDQSLVILNRVKMKMTVEF